MRAISGINKTASALFRNQKAAPVGGCRDIGDLSYHIDLHNRTRLNQTIEYLSRNKKETTKFKLCEKKFELKVVQEKVTRVLKVNQKIKIISYWKKPKKSELFLG